MLFETCRNQRTDFVAFNKVNNSIIEVVPVANSADDFVARLREQLANLVIEIDLQEAELRQCKEDVAEELEKCSQLAKANEFQKKQILQLAEVNKSQRKKILQLNNAAHTNNERMQQLQQEITESIEDHIKAENDAKAKFD